VNATESTDRRSGGWRSKLLQRLHDPIQLRVCVVATLLLVGYAAIYVPLGRRIGRTTKNLNRQNRAIDLAAEYERLQKQYAPLEHRVPAQTDAKEWAQYVLEGVRHHALKMNQFDCHEPKQFGPFKVVTFQIELVGTFFELDKFLRWLESNDRLFRVDSISIGSSQSDKGGLTMRMTVLGLSG
jgi:type II secretory pathway component PulM